MTPRRLIWALALLLLLGALAGAALADLGGVELRRGAFVGSGGTSQGGGITLRGSAGQAVVGASQGGALVVRSGFWPGLYQAGLVRDEKLYLPLTIRR